MIRKFISHPARATFALSFLITSIGGLVADIWARTQTGRSFLSILQWSYTSSQGAALTVFTPLMLAALTSLLVMVWSKTTVSLATHSPVKIASRIGLALLYLGSAFFGFAAILYVS